MSNDVLLDASGTECRSGLTPRQSATKRTFDVVGAVIGLILTSWLIILAWILASIDTRSNGFFVQERVGRHGRRFTVFKIRSMRWVNGITTNVTTTCDPRITRLGRFWRRTKIDELPQLWNVLVGDMAFVGPRPDVPELADRLKGDDRIVLTVRPGITGPATLKYRDEESLLASVVDPVRYNDEVIYPDKVRINRDYIYNWSLSQDIQYIFKTVFGPPHA